MALSTRCHFDFFSLVHFIEIFSVLLYADTVPCRGWAPGDLPGAQNFQGRHFQKQKFNIFGLFLQD